MEKENENDNSQNVDENSDSQTEKNTEELESKVSELEEQNKQLFSRAKKAEGFELKDGKWVKPKVDEKPSEETKPEVKTSELDFGHIAYHNSKKDSIKIGDDDLDFLKETMEETGKSQESILNSKWFAAELKEKQEARGVKEATPSNTRRSVPTGKGVDYWMTKDFKDVPKEMRQEVLNKRLEKESSPFD